VQHALLPVYSPLENTPHKTCNGDLSITCRNRHCPKCQSNARDRWLDARRRELLPVPYAHVVFTLPGQLAPLALQNKSEVYGLLFRASAETLLTVARDERHLGADIGFFSVLHTWNQKLLQNPHS
jgi:Transposase zinc-binding domain